LLRIEQFSKGESGKELIFHLKKASPALESFRKLPLFSFEYFRLPYSLSVVISEFNQDLITYREMCLDNVK
jgi:hypothetical protein